MASQLKQEQTRAAALANELAAVRIQHARATAQLEAATKAEPPAPKIAKYASPTKPRWGIIPQHLAAYAPNAVLLSMEVLLLCMAGVFLLSLRRAIAAAESSRKHYLAAYRRQQSVLALAEDTYAAARDVASAHMLVADSSTAPALAAEVLTQEAENTAAWATAASNLMQLTQSPTKFQGGDQLEDDEDVDGIPSPVTVTQKVAARCAELQLRVAAAESAAAEASAQLAASEKDRDWSQQKTSEVLTDNELLKERLTEARNAVAEAATREADLRAALEDTRLSLTAVQAEREALLQERDSLKAAVGEGSIAAARAAREGAALEAQVEQLTASLAAEASAKAHAEARCKQVEGELRSLKIFAESLEGQKEALKAELHQAKAAHEELRAASAQLAAAESTVLQVKAGTPGLGSPEKAMRRAVDEKVAALQRLESVERQMAVHSPGDLSPVPALPSMRHLPPSARVGALRAQVGRIMNIIDDGLASPGALSNGTHSARASGALAEISSAPSTGRRSRDGTLGSVMTSLARAQEKYNLAERLLGQPLPDTRAVLDYSDTSLLYTAPNAEEAEGKVARLAAAVDESKADVGRALTALSAQHDSPEAAAAAQDLAVRQQKVDEALAAVRAASAKAASLRTEHASLAEAARTRQAELEDAQKGLAAANDGSGSPGKEASDAAVARAAGYLVEAESAQEAAAEAVYDAERSLHAAVADELAAHNALGAAQKELKDSLEGAMGLIGARGMVEARSVSPRASLRPGADGDVFAGLDAPLSPGADVVAALMDQRFTGSAR